MLMGTVLYVKICRDLAQAAIRARSAPPAIGHGSVCKQNSKMDWIGITQITSGENVFFSKQEREHVVLGKSCLFDLCCFLIGGPSYCCQCLYSLFESVLPGSIWIVSDCPYFPFGLRQIQGDFFLGCILPSYLRVSLQRDRRRWLSNLDVAFMWYGLKRYQGTACKDI